MSAFLAYLRARLNALRAPTLHEVAGGALVAALIGCAWCAGQRSGPVDVQEVRVTHVDTVTVERIRAQEPPEKPGFIHRIAYKDVQPERVRVAPGAGADLLAAVCDTARGAAPQDTSPVRMASASDTSAAPAVNVRDRGQASPSLAYAGEIRAPWTPWGATQVRGFLVGPDGERIVDVRIHGNGEWRGVPTPVIREQRIPWRWVKPLAYTAGVLGLGYEIGRLAH